LEFVLGHEFSEYSMTDEVSPCNND
jgi:hypothetical protein